MEEKEKIDVTDESATIDDKIKMFCSGLMKVPFFSIWAMVSEEENLKLVEPEIIKNLFSDLQKENKFVGDSQYVNGKFKSYAEACLRVHKVKSKSF